MKIENRKFKFEVRESIYAITVFRYDGKVGARI